MGDIRHCVADISLAKELLGYKPRVRLQYGIRELIDWVTQQSAIDRVKQAAGELEKHKLVYSAAVPAA